MFDPTDQQIQAKAEDLGLVQAGEPLPQRQRSQVVAALLREQRTSTRVAPPAGAKVADSIVVRPGESVEVDGQPFPWVVQRDAIEVTLDPSGQGLVRLTIPTQSVQIIKPESETPP